MSSPRRLPTLESVRYRAATFCTERDWAQFHTPCNLALALLGEVGEVAECFQWKTNGVTLDALTAKELQDISEELSDVLVYTTRLCDVCSIDLAKCCRHFLSGGSASRPLLTSDIRPTLASSSSSSSMISSASSAAGLAPALWDDLQFDTISSVVQLQETNPRFFCLKLSSQMSVVSERFAARMECGPGLSDWTQQELSELAYSLASIVLVIVSIAKLLQIDMGVSVSAKIDKNEAKYPADQARGSSAKYTAYTKTNTHANTTTNALTAVLVTTSMVVLGLVLGKR